MYFAIIVARTYELTLQRNFRYISIVGFGCTLIATWEVILTYAIHTYSFLQFLTDFLACLLKALLMEELPV